jgi:hypothetical protein
MDIHERIRREIHSHAILTGRDAHRIYLGRNQMKALKQWAYNNDYTNSPDASVEGDSRPEVCGLLCWEVNDDDHVACA